MGGTLAHPRPSFNALLTEVCRGAGLDVTLEQTVLAEVAVWAKVAQREGGGRGFSLSPERSREFWSWIYASFLDELGHSDATHVAQELFHAFTRPDNYELFDDALPALEQLRAAGMRLGVISNWEAWAEQLLCALKIDQFFECAVISGMVGVEKPDPEIFRRAVETAGLEPWQAMHVGDNPVDDFAGAQAAGLTAVLIDRTSAAPAVAGRPYLMIPLVRPMEPAPPPGIKIASLTELPRLLGIA
ncbi:MAG: HAD-IA family hydrolase [Betaproteobacteria bacterium]|nr:HAD-IA family hydrolase [Betaproteobacteria bacterium]